MKVKHAKNVTKPDSGDTSLAQPSDWNADHNVTLDGNGGAVSSVAQIKPTFFDDFYAITGQNQALFFENSDTAAVDMWSFIARIKDDSTARAITYNTQFVAADGLALPSTTVVGKTMYLMFIFNAAQVKWVLHSVSYTTP